MPYVLYYLCYHRLKRATKEFEVELFVARVWKNFLKRTLERTGCGFLLIIWNQFTKPLMDVYESDFWPIRKFDVRLMSK